MLKLDKDVAYILYVEMNIEKRLSLGLITKAEALMMLNPNLSEEEAEEKLEEIESERMNKLSIGKFHGLTSCSQDSVRCSALLMVFRDEEWIWQLRLSEESGKSPELF